MTCLQPHRTGPVIQICVTLPELCSPLSPQLFWVCAARRESLCILLSGGGGVVRFRSVQSHETNRLTSLCLSFPICKMEIRNTTHLTGLL